MSSLGISCPRVSLRSFLAAPCRRELVGLRILGRGREPPPHEVDAASFCCFRSASRRVAAASAAVLPVTWPALMGCTSFSFTGLPPGLVLVGLALLYGHQGGSMIAVAVAVFSGRSVGLGEHPGSGADGVNHAAGTGNSNGPATATGPATRGAA